MRFKLAPHILATFAGFAVLYGCGGGGSAPSGGSSGDGTDQTSGMFSVRAVGNLKQLVADSSGFSVVGLYSAKISAATLNLPTPDPADPFPALRNTIITADVGGRPVIWDQNSNQVYPVATDAQNPASPSCTPNIHYSGEYVLSSEIDPNNGFQQIFRTSTDGSFRTAITGTLTGAIADTVFINLAGASAVAYTQLDSNHVRQIYSADFNGLHQTGLTLDGSFNSCLKASPDLKKLAYVSHQANQYVIQQIAVTGGSPLATWAVPDTHSICFDWYNLTDYVVADYDGSSTTTIKKVLQSTFTAPITTVSGRITSITASQTGDVFAYTLANSNSAVVVRSSDGKTISTATFTSTPRSLSWGPYLRTQKIIGTGAAYPTEAGLMYTQQRSFISAVLMFDATTPSGVTVSNLSNGTSQNLTFNVKASDSLTGLRYTTSSFQFLHNVLSGPATGAIVAFDTTTGKVASILPYNSTPNFANQAKAASKTSSFRADFTGVFDGAGNNLAKHGAREVELSSNGSVASWR